MNFEKTIEEVKNNKEISDKQLSFLMRKSHSISREIRLRIAEVLGIVNPTNKSIVILQRLLNDRDEIVAAEACDSLGYVGKEDNIRLLIGKLNSDSEIVRGYAATSIAKICSRANAKSNIAIAFIKERCLTEHSAWVLQNFYYSLYLLGEKQMLDKLIAGYRTGNYYVKKATVEMLKDSIDNNPSSIIMLKKQITNHIGLSCEEIRELMDILFNARDDSNDELH